MAILGYMDGRCGPAQGHFLRLTMTFPILLIAVIPSIFHSNADFQANAAVSHGTNLTTVLNNLLIGYDRRFPPNSAGQDQNTEVSVTAFILSLHSLSDEDMEFTVDMYFREYWRDSRLSHSPIRGIAYLQPASDFTKHIWRPDTFFVNAKNEPKPVNELVKIYPNGNVQTSKRLQVTGSCPMDLRNFPMDSQLCSLHIESFGHTMNDIRYKWKEGAYPVGISNDISLPQFKVVGHRTHASELSLTTGNYSRLALDIQITRSMGYYFLQVYIPACFFVMLSWTSFWIDRNLMTARVLTTLLSIVSLTLLASATNASLPKISYTKAIDVYLGTCLTISLLSFIETLLVHNIQRRHIPMSFKSGEKMSKKSALLKTVPEDDENSSLGDCRSSPRTCCSIIPRIVDLFSRAAFPIIFVVINMIYWIYYVTRSSSVIDDLQLV